MAPSRRKKASAAAAAAAAAQWKVGDLVLAKMKGFPAWPAMISEPEKWGLGSVKKKLLVYFYGTKQIAFCNYADLEAFTEEKKRTLLSKRQGKGADFVRAVEEIVNIYEDLKKQNETIPAADAQNLSAEISDNETLDQEQKVSPVDISRAVPDETQCIVNSEYDEQMEKASSMLDDLRQAPFSTSITTKKRNRELQMQSPNTNKRTRLQQNPNCSRSIKDDQTSGKLNCSIPDPSKAEVSEAGSGASSGRGTGGCDLPPTMACFKRKRRPNKKRASTGLECNDKENNKGGLPDSVRSTSSLGKENSESADVLSDSPHSGNNEVNKSDGDEHLPLVKRARVRMERSLVEESESNPNPKSNGDLDFFMVKTNGYVEAALPPSKRLHRALEAMSANVAETREDQTETSGLINSRPNGHAQSLENCKLPSPASPEAQSGIILSSVCDRSVKEEFNRLVSPPKVSVPECNVVHLPGTSTVSMQVSVTVSDKMSMPMENAKEGEALLKSVSSLVESNDNLVDPSVHNACHPISLVDEKREVAKLAMNSFGNAVQRGLADSVSNLGSVNRSIDIKASPISETVGNVTSMNLITDAKTSDPAEPAVVGVLSNLVNDAKSDLTVPLASTVGSMKNSCNDRKKENFKSAKDANPPVDDATRGIVESALDGVHVRSSDNDAQKLVIGESSPNVIPCLSDETKSNLSDETKSNFSAEVPRNSHINNLVYEIKRDLVAEPSAVGPLATKHQENSHVVERHVSPALISQDSIMKTHPREKCISPETTVMKDLIAAAQARRLLSRCSSLSENHLESKNHIESPMAGRDGTTVVQPSLNPAVRQTDGRVHCSGARSHAEAHAARKAFEAFLCTLTRTKDSIGRATRLAIECAKYGNAGEVMDIILDKVEKESNLHKRIDFFFLVDSIMQWARSQKGGPGDVYPSLVQSVFPRLMSLVAPPGVSAWENRKQCLKVLKLWLERRALPEYIIQQHIRQLESMNEASFSTASIRRGPMRTERAINDPLREMEGMLVDEYGSNTSFQLPPEFRTTLLEIERGESTSSDEEREFEAVTPERDPDAISPHTDLTQMTTPNPNEKQTQPHVHTLVLADVDGELEMEDVAPLPCNPAEPSVVSGADSLVSGAEAPLQGSQEAEFAPPLPEDRPPSPPPLPSSPPPPPLLPLPPPPPPPPHQVLPYNTQSQPAPPVMDHSTNPNPSTSKPVQFYNPAYRSQHPTQLPPPPPPPAHGNNYPVSSHPMNNNFRQPVSQPQLHNSSSNNGYHVQPPPPPPPAQNRYGYPHPEGGQNQPWTAPSRHSYPDNRYHPYSDVRDNRGPPYGDGRGFRGPMHSEASTGHYGPAPSDRAPGPCAGWSLPSRVPHPLPPARPAVEAPVSRVPGAHNYWRPR